MLDVYKTEGRKEGRKEGKRIKGKGGGDGLPPPLEGAAEPSRYPEPKPHTFNFMK